jgi:hypothetical protein
MATMRVGELDEEVVRRLLADWFPGSVGVGEPAWRGSHRRGLRNAR